VAANRAIVVTIGVVLVDDQELVRTGLRVILEQAPDITVLGEAADGAEALSVIQATHPEVVLMDIRMPTIDGVEATRSIRSTGTGAPTARVILLTTFDLDEYVYAGLRAGASGFLLKDTLAADLISAIRSVARGDAVIAPSSTRRLVERFLTTSPLDRPAESESSLATLTPREREILGLVGRGLSNREIASRLYLSEGTVKNHVARVLGKLQLRDRVQAVVLSYEVGLVQPGTE
jgi:DNA-binding NarL/FixJ family response regulator